MKELKTYYRQVAGWLPCSGRLKKQLMASITSTVDGYLADHPEADYAALVAHFGTPQQIATAFVDEMETEGLLNALRIRKKIAAIATAVAIAIVVLWTAVLTIALVNEIDSAIGFGQVEIIE